MLSILTYLNLSYGKELKDNLKLKPFADYINNVPQIVELISYMVENFVGKGENAGYQHFLLFPTIFSKD